MTTLSDIRERDAAWNAEEMERLPAIVDRRYLLRLIDAYQQREREARELIVGARDAHWTKAGANKWLAAREAWRAAPPLIEGEPSA